MMRVQIKKVTEKREPVIEAITIDQNKHEIYLPMSLLIISREVWQQFLKSLIILNRA